MKKSDQALILLLMTIVVSLLVLGVATVSNVDRTNKTITAVDYLLEQDNELWRPDEVQALVEKRTQYCENHVQMLNNTLKNGCQ